MKKIRIILVTAFSQILMFASAQDIGIGITYLLIIISYTRNANGTSTFLDGTKSNYGQVSGNHGDWDTGQSVWPTAQ